MSAPTGAQAAADLAATRCNQVVGSHMPGCSHVDWTRPVRVLTVVESVGNPYSAGGWVFPREPEPPVRIVPVPVWAPMQVGRY